MIDNLADCQILLENYFFHTWLTEREYARLCVDVGNAAFPRI
jgi:hypothetical protein